MKTHIYLRYLAEYLLECNFFQKIFVDTSLHKVDCEVFPLHAQEAYME
jgi:hypothetical protein